MSGHFLINMNADPALKEELARLNAAVTAAIKARTEWMDAHMEAFSTVKVGDPIYDLKTDQELGIVTALYRYRRGNPEYDTSMSIDARYKTPSGFEDNTSRQPYLLPGPRPRRSAA